MSECGSLRAKNLKQYDGNQMNMMEGVREK